MGNKNSVIFLIIFALLSSFLMADEILVSTKLLSKKEIEDYRPWLGIYLTLSPLLLKSGLKGLWALLISFYSARFIGVSGTYSLIIAWSCLALLITPWFFLLFNLREAASIMRRKKIGEPIPETKTEVSRDFYNSMAWKKARLVILQNTPEYCAICKDNRTQSWHVDHILPRSIFRKMELSLWNLRRLCPDCNKAKLAQVTMHEVNDLYSNLKTSSDRSEFERIIFENPDYRRIIEGAKFKKVA